MKNQVKVDENTANAVSNARDLMESFDDCPAMTIEYDKPEYTLTSDQMRQIMSALYLADCLIYELQQNDN